MAANLNNAPNSIALFKFDAFKRHPLRDIKGKPIAGTLDPHIWLDPDNAKAITRALAVIHSHANPQYKKLYHANAQKFAQRMDAAVAKLNLNAKQKPLPYWAYHDAYQYIESSANLQLIGSLSTDDHLAPKASHYVGLMSSAQLSRCVWSVQARLLKVCLPSFSLLKSPCKQKT